MNGSRGRNPSLESMKGANEEELINGDRDRNPSVISFEWSQGGDSITWSQ